MITMKLENPEDDTCIIINGKLCKLESVCLDNGKLIYTYLESEY